MRTEKQRERWTELGNVRKERERESILCWNREPRLLVVRFMTRMTLRH